MQVPQPGGMVPVWPSPRCESVMIVNDLYVAAAHGRLQLLFCMAAPDSTWRQAGFPLPLQGRSQRDAGLARHPRRVILGSFPGTPDRRSGNGRNFPFARLGRTDDRGGIAHARRVRYSSCGQQPARRASLVAGCGFVPRASERPRDVSPGPQRRRAGGRTVSGGGKRGRALPHLRDKLDGGRRHGMGGLGFSGRL